MKSVKRGVWVYVFVIMILVVIYYMYSQMGGTENLYYNDSYLQEDAGNITDVIIYQNLEVPTGTVNIEKNGQVTRYYTPDVKETMKAMDKAGITYQLADVHRAGFMEKAIPYIFAFVLFALYLSTLMGRVSAGGGGQNAQLMDFGKSRAKKDLKVGVTFADVAGLVEEKEELSEVVDFLKDPKKYTDLGARIPKGILLVGPPGTGKTLLGKAVSGEANVPFFSISGSDFVEMFVGVGASRVRDLFADAKKNAPCVVFIDEIDAVARRRGSGLGGGHDEREQTLNQMLVEMDGFGVNQGIIVLAATNRVDILDPAIMRPGRFDRKVSVGLPDIKGREEILKVHTRKKPIGDDVNLHDVAKVTVGFSGADLENLMNESAISAAKADRRFINKKDIDQSFLKVGVGKEKKSRIVPEKERMITAYHEAGHAILFHELPLMDPVYMISIIPTGIGAAGYTMPMNQQDNEFNTKGKMLQLIQVDLGGRIAEELILDDITTGASQDIKQASQTARDMITKYGFSEKLGLINYQASDEDEVFIGREIGHTRSYSEKIAAEIDEEVKRIVDECYAKAKEVILKNRDILDRTAEYLLENEKMTGDEFDKLFQKPVEDTVVENQVAEEKQAPAEE